MFGIGNWICLKVGRIVLKPYLSKKPE